MIFPDQTRFWHFDFHQKTRLLVGSTYTFESVFKNAHDRGYENILERFERIYVFYALTQRKQ